MERPNKYFSNKLYNLKKVADKKSLEALHKVSLKLSERNICSDDQLYENIYKDSSKNKGEKYNISKWSSLRKQYYNHLNSGCEKDLALKYLEYSHFKDKEEFEKFCNWISLSEDNMRKRSSWSKGITPDGIYSSSDVYSDKGFEHLGFNSDMIKKVKDKVQEEKREKEKQELEEDIEIENENLADDFELTKDLEKDIEDLMEEGEEVLQKKQDPKKFVQLLNRNLISMIRSFLNDDEIGGEVFSMAIKPLFELSKILKDIKTKKMAMDLSYRTSGQMRKLGFNKEADQIIKFAQQAEQEVASQPAAPVTPTAPEQAAAPVAPAPAQESSSENATPKGNKSNIDVPTSENVEPARFEDIETPGPEAGEYDNIIPGEVSITDASKKLEEVASMLADRRIIRYLAEFDIILDKLGIASMFPELAESQSKLIDAFSYALTRVTKMMGQLSNAQTLLDSSDPSKLPGTSTEFEAVQSTDSEPTLGE